MISSESGLLQMTDRLDPQTLNLQLTLENQNNSWADSIFKFILKRRE